MKRFRQEHTCGDADDVRIAYQFDRGETLSETVKERLATDVACALQSHEVTIIIRRTRAGDAGEIFLIQPDVEPDASAIIQEILTASNMPAGTLGTMLGKRTRDVHRWLSGHTKWPNSKTCKMLLSLHDEGKISMGAATRETIVKWSQRS